jgi:hypothetical protein
MFLLHPWEKSDLKNEGNVSNNDEAIPVTGRGGL